MVASYLINEFKKDERIDIIKRLWSCTDKMLVIVEAGTPKGFEVIKEAREQLLKQGGYIVAPCPTNGECHIAKDDWCHFSCRVARSKLHKTLKDGECPYEDEKFCFLAVCREPAEQLPQMRILRHPKISKGFLTVTVCTDKEITEKKFSKKDGEIYKNIRKCGAGDCII